MSEFHYRVATFGQRVSNATFSIKRVVRRVRHVARSRESEADFVSCPGIWIMPMLALSIVFWGSLVWAMVVWFF
jgi:hypothetical protein